MSAVAGIQLPRYYDRIEEKFRGFLDLDLRFVVTLDFLGGEVL